MTLFVSSIQHSSDISFSHHHFEVIHKRNGLAADHGDFSFREPNQPQVSLHGRGVHLRRVCPLPIPPIGSFISNSISMCLTVGEGSGSCKPETLFHLFDTRVETFPLHNVEQVPVVILQRFAAAMYCTTVAWRVKAGKGVLHKATKRRQGNGQCEGAESALSPVRGWGLDHSVVCNAIAVVTVLCLKIVPEHFLVR